MHKVQIQPIRKVDPMSDCSMITVGDTVGNDRNILLQRIEILQEENIELRKKQQYLKMINTTLLEALGNKDRLKKMISKLAHDSSAVSLQDPNFDHCNKMNSFKKKSRQRKMDLEEAHRRSIETVYESGDVDPNLSSKKFEVFDDDHYETLKEVEMEREREREIEKERNWERQTQKKFSKTKSPTFFENKEGREILKNKSYTPKGHDHRLLHNNSTSTRKSANNFIEPLQLHNSFSKKEMFLLGSSRSQKSPLSNYSNNLSTGKNIATGLLCDLCGVSYSPVEFMSHARQCQSKHEAEDQQLIKITDKSYEEDQTESDSDDLLSTLQQQKRALLSQIHRLKRSRNSPQKRDKSLEQIVFIINNKKGVNQTSIKNLLKEKNSSVSALTSRKRERI